ncbi:MAG TPA: hypothetical protein PLB32_07905 [Acidobacteriota bacterium]|nr:hypothetical protein [Acidobacteriota bacterium]
MDKFRYIQALWCLLLILTGYNLGWASQQDNQPVQDPSQLTSQAKAFEINGNNVQAFVTYLKFPGGERFAALIGKTDPTVYLAELDSIEAKTKGPLNPRLWLVRGDLQMQSGKNAEALVWYRKFVAAISQTADQGWEQGCVPQIYYPVSPQFLELYNGTRGPSPYEPVEIYPSLPFHFGSGSQIDNWLIQRFLTLGAWEDAEQEFKRVWAIYQDASSNNQLSGLARQFALEYAFFLIKYRQPQRGLDLLLNVFLQLDLERNPAVDFSLQENNSRHKAQANGTKAPPSHSEEFRTILLRTSVFSGSEFIRLAYGQFQCHQQIPSLTLAIQRQIQHGRNQARWVLAHILQLEGKSDEALATELEYLRHAQFNALTITYRSGLTYERFNRLSESATAFEQTLTLPDQPIALPDQDGHQSGSLVFDLSRNRTLEFSIDQKSKVLKRLFEIYCVLGETEKALNAGLRRLELESSSWRALMDDTEFEVLCNLFLLSGRQAQLTDWYRGHAHQFENYPTRKVRMSFILDDQDLFIQSLVSPTKPTKGNLDAWVKLLQSRKKEWLQPFLEAMAKADPTNEEVARALFTVNPNEPPPGSEAYWGKLFEQRSRFLEPELFFNQLSPTPQTIAMVEQILIENGKPVPGVAYGLMRMYEKTNQVDKMLALALNLARTWKLPEKRTWEEWSGSELVNPTLAIAIQHIRSPEDQKTLLQALEQTSWDKATTQLKRAIEGQDLTSPPAKPLPWHNIPNGIRLFGAHENVYSLCRDQKRVYVGYPWGVAVYNFSGHLITQIALESGAHHMTVIRGALWVGTELGVRRIDLKTFTVTGFRCDQEVLRSENQSNSNQKENWVLSLARQGNILWISTINSIRKYNTSTHELRVYQLPKKKIPERLGKHQLAG